MDSKIVNLDLSVVKNKLMHKSGESWDMQRANVAEIEYKKFLHLCQKYPEKSIGLTKEADIFWHYHILNTKKYAEDCEYIFGCFMHHDPDLLEHREEEHKVSIDNFLRVYAKEFGHIKKDKKSMALSGRMQTNDETEIALSGMPAMALSGRMQTNDEIEMALSGMPAMALSGRMQAI